MPFSGKFSVWDDNTRLTKISRLWGGGGGSLVYTTGIFMAISLRYFLKYELFEGRGVLGF